MSILKAIYSKIGLSKRLVTEETKLIRLNTCLNCPSRKYNKQTGQCKICLCVVKEKIQLKNQECPVGYWDKDN